MRKCTAEAIGTFWLTFAGSGSAVIASSFPDVGIGLLGVSLAFGLTSDHGVFHRSYFGMPSNPPLSPAVVSRRTAFPNTRETSTG